MSELGLMVTIVGDELHAVGVVSPFMCVPDTGCLRMAVLVGWSDTVTGMLSMDVVAPRVPVTVDLTVELTTIPQSFTAVTSVTRMLKAGRSAVVCEVDFSVEGGDLAVSTASFMPTPDPVPSLPSLAEIVAIHTAHRGQLSVPLAERAGCERLAPGVARIERTEDGLNAANTINGGLIGLVLEEAVLSGSPPQTVLTSLAIRYLRAARVGPVVATAERRGDLVRVEARDTGSDNRLVALATARTALLVA